MCVYVCIHSAFATVKQLVSGFFQHNYCVLSVATDDDKFFHWHFVSREQNARISCLFVCGSFMNSWQKKKIIMLIKCITYYIFSGLEEISHYLIFF